MPAKLFVHGDPQPSQPRCGDQSGAHGVEFMSRQASTDFLTLSTSATSFSFPTACCTALNTSTIAVTLFAAPAIQSSSCSGSSGGSPQPSGSYPATSHAITAASPSGVCAVCGGFLVKLHHRSPSRRKAGVSFELLSQMCSSPRTFVTKSTSGLRGGVKRSAVSPTATADMTAGSFPRSIRAMAQSANSPLGRGRSGKHRARSNSAWRPSAEIPTSSG